MNPLSRPIVFSSEYTHAEFFVEASLRLHTVTDPGIGRMVWLAPVIPFLGTKLEEVYSLMFSVFAVDRAEKVDCVSFDSGVGDWLDVKLDKSLLPLHVEG